MTEPRPHPWELGSQARALNRRASLSPRGRCRGHLWIWPKRPFFLPLVPASESSWGAPVQHTPPPATAVHVVWAQLRPCALSPHPVQAGEMIPMATVNACDQRRPTTLRPLTLEETTEKEEASLCWVFGAGTMEAGSCWGPPVTPQRDGLPGSETDTEKSRDKRRRETISQGPISSPWIQPHLNTVQVHECLSPAPERLRASTAPYHLLCLAVAPLDPGRLRAGIGSQPPLSALLRPCLMNVC